MGVARQPRVLYLSFYFPPSRASGVYRARATANHLARAGWDVTAFACPLRFLHDVVGSVDEGLAATVDPRVRVERPHLNQFAWEQDLRRFSRFRALTPILARSLYHRGQRHTFPEHYVSWARASVVKALRMHARQRFDVVLATGNPFASFGAAWVLRRLTGVPFVADYRDAWTLDMFTEEPAFDAGHPAWKWERRILRDAAASVFVNEPLRRWHAERYPAYAGRMMVVPNGWDPDLLPPTDATRTDGAATGAAPPPPDRPLRFTFLGTVNRTQPVEELVQAFQRARRHPALADATLDLHGHLGYFQNNSADLTQRLGLPTTVGATTDAGITYHGPVSKTDVGAVYRDSDVLVFLAGGARYVTSGKIFEYMATGHPIVSVHAPGIAAQDVLADYPLWFNANSLDIDEIAQSMVAAGKAARDLQPEQRAEARKHADAFSRDAVTAPLEARLRSLLRRPGAAGPDRRTPL